MEASQEKPDYLNREFVEVKGYVDLIRVRTHPDCPFLRLNAQGYISRNTASSRGNVWYAPSIQTRKELQ